MSMRGLFLYLPVACGLLLGGASCTYPVGLEGVDHAHTINQRLLEEKARQAYHWPAGSSPGVPYVDFLRQALETSPPDEIFAPEIIEGLTTISRKRQYGESLIRFELGFPHSGEWDDLPNRKHETDIQLLGRTRGEVTITRNWENDDAGGVSILTYLIRLTPGGLRVDNVVRTHYVFKAATGEKLLISRFDLIESIRELLNE